MIDHTALRRQILETRSALSKAELKRLSAEISVRFLQALRPVFSLSSTKPFHVALYRAVPGELDLRSVENELLGSGARLYFPRVKDREAHVMEFVHMNPDDPNADWVVGPYGIDEPHSELPAVDPLSINLMLVPGVAFGPNGERTGRGAGYFDRFIPSARNAFRAALAFDFQLVDRLDQNTWDQPVHWIITEKREVGRAALDKFLNKP